MTTRQIANNVVRPMKLEDVKSFAFEEATLEQDEKNQRNERADEKETWAEFMANTSLHGMRFLAEENWPRKLFWFLAIGLSFMYCLLQLKHSIQHFCDAPFVTQITMNDDSETLFPAVTLCNFNAVNKHRKWASGKHDGGTESPTRQGFAGGNANTTQGPTESNSTHSVKNITFEQVYRSASHQMEDMLLPEDLEPCTLGGVNCSASNFSGFASVHYGQCFTINSGLTGVGPVMSVARAGAGNGLRLRLNVERENYSPTHGNPMVGFKVLVHHSGVFPISVSDLGFVVEPGKHTLCSMKKKEIKNLPWPHKTNCTMISLTCRGKKTNYTRENCIILCEYKKAAEKCKCQPNAVIEGYPECWVNDAINCFLPAVEEVKRGGDCKRSCPEPCEGFHYDVQVTNAALFEEEVAKNLMTSLKKIGRQNLTTSYKKLLNSKTSEERTEFVRRNIVYLTIYFETIQYEKIEQKASFEFTDLITAFGGNQGLFLGASVLTVLEIFDFIVRRLYYFLVRKFKRA